MKIDNPNIFPAKRYLENHVLVARIEEMSSDRPDDAFIADANKLSIKDESVQKTIKSLEKHLTEKGVDLSGTEWVLLHGVNGFGWLYIDLCLGKAHLKSNKE